MSAVDHLVCKQDSDSITSSLIQRLVTTTRCCSAKPPCPWSKEKLSYPIILCLSIYWAVPKGTKQIILFRPVFLHLAFLWSRNIVKIDSKGPSNHPSWRTGQHRDPVVDQRPLLIPFFLPRDLWFCSPSSWSWAQRKGLAQLQGMNLDESQGRLYTNNGSYISFATI